MFHPINWTDNITTVINVCKASPSPAAFLAHLDPSTPLALVTEASTTAMGAVLQQRVQVAWQVLYFPRKLSAAQE